MRFCLYIFESVWWWLCRSLHDLSIDKKVHKICRNWEHQEDRWRLKCNFTIDTQSYYLWNTHPNCHYHYYVLHIIIFFFLLCIEGTSQYIDIFYCFVWSISWWCLTKMYTHHTPAWVDDEDKKIGRRYHPPTYYWSFF